MTKLCKKCKTVKLVSFFSKNIRTKDGYNAHCKECAKRYREEHKDVIFKLKKDWRERNKEKVYEKLKQWRSENKDKLASYDLKYRNTYPEKIIVRGKEYYEKNNIKIKNKVHEYRIKNRDKVNESARAYAKSEKGRAVSKNMDGVRRSIQKNGDIKSSQLREILTNAKKCYWCNSKLVKKHIDHYIPLSKGGKHTISNIVVSCPTCNLKKTSKNPYEFANTIGRLL